MGADKQELRSKGLLPSRSNSNDKGHATWADADPNLVHALVIKMTDMGGAVRFGLTRDGGTYNVGLYLGDERNTYYFRRDQDIDAGLRDFLGELEDLPVDQIKTDRRAKNR